jgi:hypothetical protein
MVPEFLTLSGAVAARFSGVDDAATTRYRPNEVVTNWVSVSSS